MKKSAIKSSDGKYRYLLTRDWDSKKPHVGFLLMNPSKADEKISDQTLTRLVKRASILGYGGLKLANLCAYITSKPEELERIENPIGEDNIKFIQYLIDTTEVIIVGWGDVGHKYYHHYESILPKEKLFCLGINNSGAPSHPLYKSYSKSLIPY